MVLNISDILLLEDNVVEVEMEIGDDGEECIFIKKRKRIEEEKDDFIIISIIVVNVFIFWL